MYVNIHALLLAVMNIDYSPPASNMVTITPPENMGCVTVATIDDAISEDDESFDVNFAFNATLSNFSNVTVSPNSATVIIQDNDSELIWSLS